ncbi:class IIb bacteriocin, lactobin A/cerein 7B family [Niallia taxi]|nr:class IIb bacteriocin, lactobin A/cerein 7B family [Niallia taxi]MDE5056013.1 class IIb bacteriocin, lactobin A/cerein 7B family [Niallia taxi]
MEQKLNLSSLEMKELTNEEMQSVDGGVLPLLAWGAGITFTKAAAAVTAGAGVVGAGYVGGKWVGKKIFK